MGVNVWNNQNQGLESSGGSNSDERVMALEKEIEATKEQMDKDKIDTQLLVAELFEMIAGGDVNA